ncbi:MAG: MFS transporter [Conexivisphaerales archaeon]
MSYKLLSDRETVIEKINNAPTSKYHYMVWLVSGMGFFTDAYDLFIIGAVLTLLPLAGWNELTSFETSLLASTALISAVIGAIAFGWLLDHLGRRAVYGLELAILIIGALGSALLTPINAVYILMAWRFMLGIGIGGDYAASSTIMAEYSSTKNRGKLVGMVFSMQSLGLLAGPLVTLALLFSGIAPTLIWKLLLAFGSVPALLVIYWRRHIPETPKFSVGVRGDTGRASRDLYSFTGVRVEVTKEKVQIVKVKWHKLFTDKRLLLLMLGTAGSWFLMDWALYGNSIMSSTMLGLLVPSVIKGLQRLIITTEYTALVFGLAAVPGYWLATFTIDRIGRKPIQAIGFLAMAASFLLLGIIPGIMSPATVIEFLSLYGVSYFFIEFGPNVTTFIYPPEVYPVPVRGLGTGISAAGGKIGASLGTLLNLAIIASFGESGLFILLAFFSLIGLVLTIALLPESKMKALEESSQEEKYLTEKPVIIVK